MLTYTAEHLRHITDYTQARLKADAELKPRPLPTKPAEMTWRDYLVLLLHVGAELEHGLMVQYLYAAYSLGADGVPPEDRPKVKKWQDALLTVAREEMGHLLTVQNLLCLIGGPVSVNRNEFPWDTPFFPFEFMLEPVSKASLAKYVFAEMPGNVAFLEGLFVEAAGGKPTRSFIDKDIPFLRATMKQWVQQRGRYPQAEIYMKILHIFESPEYIPDSVFRPDTYPLQASWDDWGRSYAPRPSPPYGPSPKIDTSKAHIVIERAATRTEALYALRMILGQGEASEIRHGRHPVEIGEQAPDRELSHFERFVEIFREFDEKKISASWNPVRDVPVNPTTIGATGEPDARRASLHPTSITAKASLKWANLFNLRYRMLLSYITHTFRLSREVPPDEPNARGAMMAKIFGEMYNLKAIAGILVDMPLTDEPGDQRRAGPPFEMPYSIDLPLDEIDCWSRHRDVVQSSLDLCHDLLDQADGDFASAPPAGGNYLRALRNQDQNTLAWIDTVLAGRRARGGGRP